MRLLALQASISPTTRTRSRTPNLNSTTPNSHITVTQITSSPLAPVYLSIVRSYSIYYFSATSSHQSFPHLTVFRDDPQARADEVTKTHTTAANQGAHKPPPSFAPSRPTPWLTGANSEESSIYFSHVALPEAPFRWPYGADKTLHIRATPG